MKLKRAYSPGEVLNMKIPRFEFSGDWQTSIGNPAKSGVWIIWEASGNGKSSFVMQLAKYLCSFGRVIYDSLEESTGLSFQMSLKRHKMGEVKKKLIILDREPMEQLEVTAQRQSRNRDYRQLPIQRLELQNLQGVQGTSSQETVYLHQPCRGASSGR